MILFPVKWFANVKRFSFYIEPSFGHLNMCVVSSELGLI